MSDAASMLWEQYRIGPHLERAWADAFDAPLHGLMSAASGAESLWADFALTANIRGAGLAWQVTQTLTRGWPTLRGLEVLDVGTGIGGFAVGAAGLGGRVSAIDLDPERIELARANARDHDAPVDFAALSLTDAAEGRLGPFDAVVAEDVLEHVDDARAGVHQLAELTRPGRLVVTTIPNGDALANVIADGHYALPGITLLRRRKDAEAYHGKRFPQGNYDVGNYHGWDQYERWFESAGLHIDHVDHLDVDHEVPVSDLLSDAEKAVRTVIDDASLPGPLRTTMASEWESYRERVAAARSLPDTDMERRIVARAWRIFAWMGTRRRPWRWSGPTAPRPEGWREALRRIPGLAGAYRRFRR